MLFNKIIMLQGLTIWGGTINKLQNEGNNYSLSLCVSQECDCEYCGKTTICLKRSRQWNQEAHAKQKLNAHFGCWFMIHILWN